MKPSFIRAVLIAAVVLAAAAAVYFGWRAFFGADTETSDGSPFPSAPAASLPVAPGTSSDSSGSGAETESGKTNEKYALPAGTIRKISDNPVFDFWTDTAAGETYYLAADGRVFAAAEGSDREISRQTLDALIAAEPSPSSQKILASFGDPASPHFAVFSATDASWRPLPADVHTAAWGGNDEELFVAVGEGASRTLARVNLSKPAPEYHTIFREFPLEDVAFTFRTSPAALIVAERPSVRVLSHTWLVDLSSKTPSFQTLFPAERGFSLTIPGRGPVLLAAAGGKNFRILDSATYANIFPVSFSTFAEKCAARHTADDGSFLWCFVPDPRELAGASLPDDYLMKKVMTDDALYMIGTEEGVITEISLLENGADAPAIDAKKPRYGGGMLYFINRYDGYLYEAAI